MSVAGAAIVAPAMREGKIVRDPMFTVSVCNGDSAEEVEVFQLSDSGFDLEFWLGGRRYYVVTEKRIEENRWVVYGYRCGYSDRASRLGVVGGPYWPTVPEMISLVSTYIGFVKEWDI